MFRLKERLIFESSFFIWDPTKEESEKRPTFFLSSRDLSSFQRYRKSQYGPHSRAEKYRTVRSARPIVIEEFSGADRQDINADVAFGFVSEAPLSFIGVGPLLGQHQKKFHPPRYNVIICYHFDFKNILSKVNIFAAATAAISPAYAVGVMTPLFAVHA